jgi:topoisomerase-4 subunit A
MADYKEYGIATIQDRAIVGGLDGMKPVMRRILWSMHGLGLGATAKTVKAALIVGQTMGYLHPHGDASIFDAAVAATQLPQPLIDGSDSNWGTMTSGSGAMRYINGRLTKYADSVFFDPFYTPVMEFTPNYDGSKLEPVNLVTLLPNGLLNGNFGICPGVNTRTPAFTLKTVAELLVKIIDAKGVCKPIDCLSLEWISDYGGVIKKTAANKAALKAFYLTGEASLDWSSTFVLDEAANTIRFNRFAPFSTNDKAANATSKSPLEKLISNVENLNGVQSIDDDSSTKDPFRQAYIIRLNRTCKGTEREKTIKALENIFSARLKYDVKVTDRAWINAESIKVSLRPVTVPELLSEWVRYRMDLERKACLYWIDKRDVEIKFLQLMRLAISKLDFIFACVRDKKLDDAQLVKKISTGLKITDAETNQILGRNLRQLRHLEDKELADKIDKLTKERDGFAARAKAPSKYVKQHIQDLAVKLKSNTQ